MLAKVVDKLFPPEQAPDGNQYSWARRRRYLCAVTAFCMAVIAYVLWTKTDTRVAETAVSMAFLCLIGMVASYVFGAAWQDVSHMRINAGTSQFGASGYRTPGMTAPGYARTSAPVPPGTAGGLKGPPADLP